MIDPDDKVKAYVNVKTLKDEEFINNNYIMMVTRQGVVKKTSLEAYSRPRTNGVNAINIREDDELLEAILTNGRCFIMIAAHGGRCVRFDEREARPLGRTSTGVRGINLDEGDYVIGVVCQDPEAEGAENRQVLVVSENGFGKRSDPNEYRQTARGAKGVITLKITEKTGALVAIKNRLRRGRPDDHQPVGHDDPDAGFHHPRGGTRHPGGEAGEHPRRRRHRRGVRCGAQRRRRVPGRREPGTACGTGDE